MGMQESQDTGKNICGCQLKDDMFGIKFSIPAIVFQKS